MKIRIPDFLERSYGERFLLVSSFFQNEAEILKERIYAWIQSISEEMLKSARGKENIGAVKK